MCVRKIRKRTYTRQPARGTLQLPTVWQILSNLFLFCDWDSYCLPGTVLSRTPIAATGEENDRAEANLLNMPSV